MSNHTILVVIAAAALSAACVEDPGEVERLDGQLDLAIDGSDLTGSFVHEGQVVVFESRRTADGARADLIELNGMVLEYVYDDTVILTDAYSLDGQDTQLHPDDYPVLDALLEALQTEAETGEERPLLDAFVATVDTWSEWSPSNPVAKLVLTEEAEHATWGTSLCGYVKCASPSCWECKCDRKHWYKYGKHDCSKGGYGTYVNQQAMQLGRHSSCKGDEWYWTGSAWKCGDGGHYSRRYVAGNCMGRCGKGCGNSRQYTVACANHDGCVRNGHSLVSLYCDDEFTSTINDRRKAPNCY